MLYTILIFDRGNRIPYIGGTYDTENAAMEESINIKDKMRRADKNCENCYRWVEETTPNGGKISYYIDKEFVSKIYFSDKNGKIVTNENGKKMKKYVFDQEKAARSFWRPNEIEDLKNFIRLEIISVEPNKSGIFNFTVDQDCELWCGYNKI